MTPAVSVIIPAYNRAGTLARALDSVAAQTFTDYEVIVVDDGSTDGTADCCAARGDPRLRLLRHGTNRGAAAARNTGVAAATGTWCAFLDSDDAWSLDKLARQIAFMQHGNPPWRASCTAYRLHDGRDRRDYTPAPSTRPELLLHCDQGPGTTLVAERALFTEVGPFAEDLPRYEDWDWLLRCERQCPIGLLSEPLAEVHFCTARSAAGIEQSALAFLARYGVEFDRLGRFGRRARGLRWLEAARYHALERNPGRFVVCLARALRAYPFYGPGSYLLLVDAWFGTGLARAAVRLRDRLHDRRRGPAGDR